MTADGVLRRMAKAALCLDGKFESIFIFTAILKSFATTVSFQNWILKNGKSNYKSIDFLWLLKKKAFLQKPKLS